MACTRDHLPVHPNTSHEHSLFLESMWVLTQLQMLNFTVSELDIVWANGVIKRRTVKREGVKMFLITTDCCNRGHSHVCPSCHPTKAVKETQSTNSGQWPYFIFLYPELGSWQKGCWPRYTCMCGYYWWYGAQVRTGHWWSVEVWLEWISHRVWTQRRWASF